MVDLTRSHPGYSFTPREREIAQRLVLGETNKQIAAHFFISIETVKRHLNNIFNKTGMGSRAELVIYLLSKGIFSIDSTLRITRPEALLLDDIKRELHAMREHLDKAHNLLQTFPRKAA